MKKLKRLLFAICGLFVLTLCPVNAEAKEIPDANHIIEDYQVVIPDEVINNCEEISLIYQISPEFLEAIAWKESTCNKLAKNGNCIGLMQISENYHKDRMERLGASNLYDMYGNILVSADYLSELFSEYESPEVVLAVYNGDSKALNPGYESTYAETILNLSIALETQHGKN